MTDLTREEMISAIAQTEDALIGLQARLPTEVPRAFEGTWSKLPSKALCVRAGLAWRLDELSRNALAALRREEVATGATLARAAFECCAAVWRLRKYLQQRYNLTAEEMDGALMGLLMGHKGVEGMPSAPNVMTMIQHVDRDLELEDFTAAYASLSEIAHPNWTGTFFLFGRVDQDAGSTHFGRHAIGRYGSSAAVAGQLNCGLLVFESASAGIDRIVTAWLSELGSN